jgi:oligopeptidase A
MSYRIDNFIDGETTESRSERFGAIFNPATGQSFLKNILEKGGSKEPMELFRAFRGREPKVDALLRHSGIAA